MRLGRLLRDMGRNRRGSVLMLFAFAVIPLIVAVGCAVDYSQAARSRSHIATSADAAALAAAKAAQQYMNTYGVGPAAFTAATALAQTAMSQTFTANQANDTFSKNPSAALTLTQDATGAPIANVTARANAPTAFMRLVGISTVPVSTTSQAKAGGGTFYQIIFVVDVSNSMAIGGTAQDITNLQNDLYIAQGNSDGTYKRCAFACHDPNHTNPPSYASDYCAAHVADYFCHVGGPMYCPWGANGCARIQTTAFADKRAFAKQFGYKLKIDYVNDAVGTFVTQLTPLMNKAPAYYSIGITTFGTNATQLTFGGGQSMTSDPTALQAAASTIDVETAAPAASGWGYTKTATSLNAALASVANIGDGSSATKRKTFFIFVSDGAEDVADPGSFYGRAVDVNYASACSAIKAAGDPNNSNARPIIFSIDATYYPVSDQAYVDLISSKGLDKLFPTTMQACATSTTQYQTYFQASDGPAIKTAVQQVFTNIFGGSLRLSR